VGPNAAAPAPDVKRLTRSARAPIERVDPDGKDSYDPSTARWWIVASAAGFAKMAPASPTMAAPAPPMPAARAEPGSTASRVPADWAVRRTGDRAVSRAESTCGTPNSCIGVRKAPGTREDRRPNWPRPTDSPGP